MKTIKVLFIVALTFSTNAFAQYHYPEQYPTPNYQPMLPTTQVAPQTFTDYAKIIRVTPEYQQVNQPQQICNNVEYMEQVPPQGRNYGGAVIGGVAGAILGNQVGGGNGKTAATALGGVVGAFAGDHVANPNYPPQYQPRVEQRCHTNNVYRKELTGYRVEYEYRGMRQSFISPTEPVGNKLRMTVTAFPELN